MMLESRLRLLTPTQLPPQLILELISVELVEFEVAPMVGIPADVRYSLGLSNIVDVTVPAGGTELSAKTRGFQILVGVLFRVGG